MSNCTSGCKTQDHPSYGACLRAKSMAVMGLESTGNDYTKDQKMHRENAAYRAARAEGLQPTMPTMKAVDEAKRKADATGKAD